MLLDLGDPPSPDLERGRLEDGSGGNERSRSSVTVSDRTNAKGMGEMAPELARRDRDKQLCRKGENRDELAQVERALAFEAGIELLQGTARRDMCCLVGPGDACW